MGRNGEERLELTLMEVHDDVNSLPTVERSGWQALAYIDIDSQRADVEDHRAQAGNRRKALIARSRSGT